MIRKLLFPFLIGLLLTQAAYAQPPVPTITADKTVTCAGDFINFSTTTTGAYTYKWNYSASPPTIQPGGSNTNQKVLFLTGGDYTVSLTISDATGSSTSNVINIHINAAPVADFDLTDPADTIGCAPWPVQFLDKSVAGSGATITSWVWYYGDGTIDNNIQNPTHKFQLPANYTVNLKVTNNFGCEGNASLKTKTGYIAVKPGVTPNFSYTLSASCKPPTTANFTNSSSGPGTLTYTWNFGDGSPVDHNPTPAPHVYATAGHYGVSLTVSSDQGCTDTYTDSVFIGSGSVSSVMIVPDTVCQNTPVLFKNGSTPIPNSSLWSFGDGNTSSQSDTTYTYTTTGKYTVTLTNHFATCDDQISKNVVVLAPSNSDFSGTNTVGCKAPLTVSFHDLSPGATSWAWDFGDGSPVSNQQNPTHTYLNPGQFTVQLIATNGGGCGYPVAKTNFVQIIAPIVKVNGLPGRGCAPQTLTFTPNVVAPDGVASYSWDFGNGVTFVGSNPPAQTYGAGRYKVTLTVTTNGGCTGSYSDSVIIGTQKPTVAFTANPTTACYGTPIQFTDQSTGGPDEWLWTFGDGNTSTDRNPLYTYINPGTFSVTLRAFKDGCYDEVTKTNLITINAPKANFGFKVGCTNKLLYTFTDSTIGGVSYDWNFGDGSPHYTGGANPPPHTYPNVQQTYTVVLTVKNGACTNVATKTINVLHKTDFNAANSFCKNSPASVTVDDDPANAAYIFDFGDGYRSDIVTSKTWSHIYTTTGQFDIKVITIDTAGCMDSLTKPKYITISGPTADFNAPVTQACNSLSAQFNNLSTDPTPINSYAWDFGDGSTSSSANPNHIYTNQGIFPVKLAVTDAAGCRDSITKSRYIIVSVPTASFTTPDSLYCPSSLIKFTNTSPPPGGFNPKYHWDFGDATSFDGQNPPLHNYPNVNRYDVTLSVIDDYGCTAVYSKPKYIRIDTPTASFLMSDSFAACPPLFVNFTFTGSYAKTFTWDFGHNQGAVQDSVKTNHLYAIPGTYTAQVTVISPGGCTAVASKQIVVNGPYAEFKYSPTGGCDSLTVFFLADKGTVTDYTWYPEENPLDSFKTSVPNFQYKYTKPGRYVPILRLLDAAGCSVPYVGSDPIIIDSVKAKIYSDKPLLCEDGIINFTDTSSLTDGTVITDHHWDFGDGNTGSGKTVSHFYTTPGQYTVKLVVTTQFGCMDSVTQLIKVVANPTVDIGGVVPQCVPGTLNFTGIILVPDTSALTWQWSFDNGQTSTLQNPVPQLYDKAGHYNIQLVATNSSGCNDTALADLYIYPLPSVYAGADTTICLGTSALLQASGANTYNWLPPTNTSLSCTACQNTSATPTVTTTYVVQGTSALGCQANDTVIVTVNQPVTLTVSPDDSVCIGQSTQLKASGAYFYTWTPAQSLNNPALANPIATPSMTTQYQVVGNDSKYCFADTKYVNITVFNYPTIDAGPDATINVGSSYQITATGSSDIVNLNWLPVNGLSCTNCYTPVATPSKTTTYVASVVNNGGCAAADSIRITVICNNANFFVPNTFSPNNDGMNDVFYVRGKGLNVIPSITIFNRWGQIVFQKRDFSPNDPSAGWDGTFNGQKAPSDVYVYTLDIICDNSTLIPYHGNITLIR